MIDYIDLSGEWLLALDKQCNGKDIKYFDTITLPNTTSNAKKGEYNNSREISFLTDTYKFEGWAWFKKRVDFDKLNIRRIYISLNWTSQEMFQNILSVCVNSKPTRINSLSMAKRRSCVANMTE